MNRYQHDRRLVLAAMAASCVAPAHAADDYPSRPITMIVPFAAGGSTDSIARTIGRGLSTAFKQPVIVENRPGAGSMMGTAMVAKANPDGYTLLMSTIALAINAGMRPNLPFDPIKDLVPVVQISSLPLILVVNHQVPCNNLAEFVALAKSQPGKLNYASSGSGTSPHLAGEMFKTLAGIQMTHVPYKGNGPVLQDLLAGHVDLHFGLAGAMLPYVRDGKLKALAVTTETRIDALPDVPTIAESGYPDYEINSWQGLYAPGGTPRPIVARINSEVVQMVRSAELQQLLAKEGSTPVGSTPEAFAKHVRSEIQKWEKVARISGAKAAD
jgi:tripartite-type tricarboxylate transporter receptor subunit TctC